MNKYLTFLNDFGWRTSPVDYLGLCLFEKASKNFVRTLTVRTSKLVIGVRIIGHFGQWISGLDILQDCYLNSNYLHRKFPSGEFTNIFSSDISGMVFETFKHDIFRSCKRKDFQKQTVTSFIYPILVDVLRSYYNEANSQSVHLSVCPSTIPISTPLRWQGAVNMWFNMCPTAPSPPSLSRDPNIPYSLPYSTN